MSGARFARVHAGLLARKGEAAPAALHPGANVTYLESPAPRRPARRDEAVEFEQPQGEHFRLALRMTKEQRRKMWLVSARLGLSRQEILDRALDTFMAEIAGTDMKDCHCFGWNDTPGSCDLGH